MPSTRHISVWFSLLIVMSGALRAAVPPDLAAALKVFHAEPPRGWSFRQTTVAEGRSMTEACDGGRPEFSRWTLIEKDGRTPTADEIREYDEGRSRRSRGGTAPNLTEQFDLATLETVAETPERATYRCRLRRGESRDVTAPHLRATIVVHRPTQSVETIELANDSAFSPTFGVKIAEMKTTLTYSTPTADRPSFPQRVTTHVRGRAFLVKSLDADMLVTFSDYATVGAQTKK